MPNNKAHYIPHQSVNKGEISTTIQIIYIYIISIIVFAGNVSHQAKTTGYSQRHQNSLIFNDFELLVELNKQTRNVAEFLWSMH